MIAFGVTFAYPLFGIAGARMDPRAMPWFHRMQQLLGKRLISPGLAVVLIAGVYLASKLHMWHFFYVQWGVAVVVVLGGLEGAFMAPRQKKLIELAERDIAAASAGEVTLGPEYQAVVKQVGMVGGLMGVLVLVTIYLMSIQA
jgi:hypothetical protein